MDDDFATTEHFDCECWNPKHTVRFYLVDWGDDEPPTLEAEFYLHHHKRWWTRLWTAIRYVLGHKASCFCGFEMRRKDIPRFKRMIEDYEKRWVVHDTRVVESKNE